MTIGLAIIDVQKAFLSEDHLGQILHGQESLHIINACSAAFRAAQQPVFRVYDHGAGHRDDMNYEFIDQVARDQGDIIIHKQAGNAFNGTAFHDHIKELKVELLLLCGYRSEYCIHATAMGARDLGLSFGVIRDAHLTPDRDAFKAVEKLLPMMSYQMVDKVVKAFAGNRQ